MKYTTEKALAEIMLRSEQIVIRKNRKSCRVLSCTAGVLLAALTLIIALLPGKANVEYSDSIYGSFLLSREAGGYVLASVVAFVLGVCVTVLCLKYRSLKQRKSKKTKNHDMEDKI